MRILLVLLTLLLELYAFCCGFFFWQGIVEIEDIPGPVLRELLHFIYTGEVSDSNLEEMGVDLLAASDKVGYPAIVSISV